jgi:hypothetical protein
MFGDVTRLHRSQGIAKQCNHDRVESSATTEMANQRTRTGLASRLRYGNTPDTGASQERFPIEWPARCCGCAVEDFGSQDSSKSGERPLSRTCLRRLAFPDLEGVALLSNRSHGASPAGNAGNADNAYNASFARMVAKRNHQQLSTRKYYIGRSAPGLHPLGKSGYPHSAQIITRFETSTIVGPSPPLRCERNPDDA